jgi:LPXTG-motif cell wall-anchored protein
MLRSKLVRAAAAGGLVVGSLIPASAAFAVYGEPDPGSGGADNGGSGNGGDGGSLPVTGGDIAGLTLVGGALALGGTVLVRSGRRKSVIA